MGLSTSNLLQAPTGFCFGIHGPGMGFIFVKRTAESIGPDLTNTIPPPLREKPGPFVMVAQEQNF